MNNQPIRQGPGRPGGFGRSGGRPNFRSDDFIEKVVQIKRVNKKTKGGNQISFTALVVVGDGKGRVSYSLQRAKDVGSAIRKGMKKAREEMVKITIKDGTIPCPIKVKYKSAKVILKPARSGTGLIAGGPLRVIANAAGIENLVAKILGSRNKMINVQAAFKAFEMIKDK